MLLEIEHLSVIKLRHEAQSQIYSFNFFVQLKIFVAKLETI